MNTRLSILGMMAFVGVVAAETALARAFWTTHQPIVVGVVPTAALIQLAAWHAYRGKRGRAFALGALAGGLLMTASFIYAELTPEVLGVRSDFSLVRKPGSRIHDAWTAYREPTFKLIVQNWPSLIDPDAQLIEDGAPSWKLVGVQSLVNSLPQWLAALVGGLLFWGAATIRSRRLTSASRDGYSGLLWSCRRPLVDRDA